MMICGDILYTVGEEQVVNRFKVGGGRKVKLEESREFEKLVSLLFVVNGVAYMSLY